MTDPLSTAAETFKTIIETHSEHVRRKDQRRLEAAKAGQQFISLLQETSRLGERSDLAATDLDEVENRWSPVRDSLGELTFSHPSKEVQASTTKL